MDAINQDNDCLVGNIVEVHITSGKRFFGRVRRQSRDGVLVYGVPVRVFDAAPTSVDMRDDLRRMLSTVFVPFVGIEYIDIGGEPIGFDRLYGPWFGGEALEIFFTHPLD